MLKYKIEDYIGKKYGHLKVLGKAIESNVPNCFLFLCDCGREISLAPDLVIKGHQKSCGKCLFSNEYPARIKPEDYIGKRNNLLTVVSTHKEPKGRTKLICLCDCGKTTEVFPYQFKKGSIKSCVKYSYPLLLHLPYYPLRQLPLFSVHFALSEPQPLLPHYGSPH